MAKLPVGCTNLRVECREGFELVEPLPGVFICRDKKTGETEQPKITCDPVLVDDPLTQFRNGAVKLGLIALAFVGLGTVLSRSKRR